MGNRHSTTCTVHAVVLDRALKRVPLKVQSFDGNGWVSSSLSPQVNISAAFSISPQTHITVHPVSFPFSFKTFYEVRDLRGEEKKNTSPRVGVQSGTERETVLVPIWASAVSEPPAVSMYLQSTPARRVTGEGEGVR